MRDDHMKLKARKPFTEVGAAEFKAKCLGLIDEIHSRKRNQVIVTKRGKPYAKLVPVDSEDEPFYGCLEGMATIRGDITKPIDVDWNALK
jgi:prevent-host-death family protein